MSAIAEASLPVSINRRRRVRQKVHAPAYASFGGASNSGASNSGASNSGMIDLYEVLDISEVGVALQCSSPMKIGQQLELSLDLAEARGPIYTTARVVWSDEAGRVGLSLPTLGNSALHRLQEWLFLNAMASAANAASSGALPPISPSEVPRPNYTDTLTAASAIQREAESQGSDLEAVLSLIASRSQSLLRVSGAAIALAAKDPGTMICRASAGPGAPPVGATLQVGSGFSGECVRTGRILRCDDTETDERVDSKSCRALGIRSMLAAPLRLGDRVVGLLEVFSEQPGAFGENDTGVLQRFAETIVAAVNRAVRVHQPAPDPVSPKYSAPPGSTLFAREPELNSEKKGGSPKDGLIKDALIKDSSPKDGSASADEVGGIRLPRAHLYFLVVVAAIIFLVLGYTLAPWIQEKLQGREQIGEQTVLASTQAPPQATVIPPTPAVEAATLDQLRQFAAKGEPAAEYALGMRYASGEGVKQDDKEAASWFLKAAENGNVKAQATLGTRYWGGRGVPPSVTQAYFWTVLARAAGDQNSKTFAEILASRMTHAQAVAIEQKAEIWYEQHEPTAKPAPGR
jgi:TPR repeat protein/putative methionine-R-sulfoxide reductase with GAF domain